MKKKYAPCPNCCPTPHALFQLECYEWVCQNCHHRIPYVRRSLPSKPGPKMQRTIDRIADAFGGETVKVEMIGRNAWISLNHQERSFYDSRRCYGIVYCNGKFRLHLPVPLSDEVIIDNWSGVNVWLRDHNPAKAEEVKAERQRMQRYLNAMLATE